MEKRSLQPRIQQAGAWLPSWCTALRAGGKQSWAIGKACQEAADLKRMKKKPRRLEHHFQREPEHHFQRETSSSFPPPVTPPPLHTTLASSPISITQTPFPSNTLLLNECWRSWETDKHGDTQQEPQWNPPHNTGFGAWAEFSHL